VVFFFLVFCSLKRCVFRGWYPGYVCYGGQCVWTTFISYHVIFRCCTKCRGCLLFSSGVKLPERENDRSSLFSAEVKNTYIFTSSLPYVSMAWYLSSGTTSLYLNREGCGMKRVRYCTCSDNKVCELATVRLPWEQWTDTSVWFDDVSILAFHSCVIVNLWLLFLSGVYYCLSVF
jgi:hypothetical protein